MMNNLGNCTMAIWRATQHVNNILVQPHWRSHEELIKQQVD